MGNEERDSLAVVGVLDGPEGRHQPLGGEGLHALPGTAHVVVIAGPRQVADSLDVEGVIHEELPPCPAAAKRPRGSNGFSELPLMSAR